MLIARLARVEADRRYARHVNFREGWRGFLWQGRFASFPLDGDYLLAAARYIELNPVRARLADSPDGWQWSSARAHISGRDDDLSKTAPLLAMVGDWRTLLSLTTKSTLCVATSAPAAPSARKRCVLCPRYSPRADGPNVLHRKRRLRAQELTLVSGLVLAKIEADFAECLHDLSPMVCEKEQFVRR